MRIHIVTTIIIILKTCSGEMEPFIVNGINANIEDWPFIVFIMYHDIHDKLKVTCGGSLLSSQTVLTAAHCLDDVTEYKKRLPTMLKINHLARHAVFKKLSVQMGHAEWRKAKMRRDVVDYQTHDKYDTDSTDFDIGIMFLLSPVTFSGTIQKTVLQATPLVYPMQKNLLVAGWGQWSVPRNKSYFLSEKLQYLPHELIPKNVCEKKLNLRLKYGTMCAGSLADKKYVFSGDSGGPLVTADGFQIGIVSHKLKGNAHGITIFTHIPDYWHWIQKTQMDLFRKYCPENFRKKKPE